ncbi:MAG: hypothetical protein IRY99_23285 [Isosphaeraceae bacterium]|nr:hypothetical protein [Isosphaeraceae bacterium]
MSGESRISLDTLDRLAELLGLTVTVRPKSAMGRDD